VRDAVRRPPGYLPRLAAEPCLNLSSTNLLRKLAFTLLVVGPVFCALEGSSSWYEHRRAARPVLPEPSPEAPPSGFEARAAQAREAQGLPRRERVPCPLIPDKMVGWKLPPELTPEAYAIGYRVNSQGYRGGEFTTRKPGSARLLSVGDSTIFGDGMAEQEVFSSVAARHLAAGWGVEVDAVIGALPGHDTEQSLLVLRQLAPLLRPDWVLVGNLWSDVYRRDRMRPSAPDAIRSFGALEPLRTGLRRSATYRVAKLLLAPHLMQRKVGFIASMDDVAALSDGPAARVPLASYLQNLRALAASASQAGARPLFLLLPAPVDLEGSSVPGTVAEYRLAMRRVAREVGAPLVDGPALFREKKVTIAYFFDQVHPVQEGHALLGEAVAEAILSHMPSPPAPENP
jgi:lysophospholipase L1-like esterase